MLFPSWINVGDKLLHNPWLKFENVLDILFFRKMLTTLVILEKTISKLFRKLIIFLENFDIIKNITN